MPFRPSAVLAAVASASRRGTVYIARTVHGLEPIAAAELAGLGHRVIATAKRQLFTTAQESGATPRTVDDLTPLVACTPDPGGTKADLRMLHRRLAEALGPLSLLRGSHVTVSASFSGRRTFNRYDIEDTVGAVLADRLGAHYDSRRDGARPPADAIEFRVALSEDGCFVGFRGDRPPLHRRTWKTASIPGTLHPPVAAAMVRLARIRPGMTVLDPCCGAGTIPVETSIVHPDACVSASDIDPAALHAAAVNAREQPEITLSLMDAAELPRADASVDRIVTNPPWDRQVAARSDFATLLREWHRVLRPDGRLVCLVTADQVAVLDDQPWKIREARPLSVAGRHPVLVTAHPR
jgi:tRNA (guanine6-N2)-methyltransferase